MSRPSDLFRLRLADAIEACRLMEMEADRNWPPPEGETKAQRCARIVRYCEHAFGRSPATGQLRAVPLPEMIDRTYGLGGHGF